MTEYIIYKNYLKPTKGQLPEIIKEYVANTSHINAHIDLTRNRQDAYRFVDSIEAESIAYLLDMQVEKIEVWE